MSRKEVRGLASIKDSVDTSIQTRRLHKKCSGRLITADSCRNIHIYAGYIPTQWTTDARRKTSLTIFTSHLIARVRKGLLKVCVWDGAGDRTELQYFDPHSYGRHVVSFLFSWCSTGGPEAHSSGWWLPLLHLISNFSGPQTPSGFPRAPSAGCGFPYHTRLWLRLQLSGTAHRTQLSWLLSWLSYIIVQHPLDRQLDLWNHMYNRHQAEITVMQFRGHSLAVRQSMRVSWDFLACPILLANFRPGDFLS